MPLPPHSPPAAQVSTPGLAFPAWFWILPLAALLFGGLFEYSGADLFLAEQFYDRAAQTWPWQNRALTKFWLHDFVQTVLLGVGVGLLVWQLLCMALPSWRPRLGPLAYVFVSALCSLLLIGWIKHHTRIYIPWDLEIFDGRRPYVRLLDTAPLELPPGRGFPSAHAASGYVWFSLYFLARHYKPNMAAAGFALPLILGVLLGGAQQVRGAHFLSHDLFSLTICWVSAWGFYVLFAWQGWLKIQHDFPLLSLRLFSR